MGGMIVATICLTVLFMFTCILLSIQIGRVNDDNFELREKIDKMLAEREAKLEKSNKLKENKNKKKE